MHDVDLQRMAQRADLIADLSYATLRRIDLGGGATAPRLRDVLDLALPMHKRVNIEIKADVPDLRALALATGKEVQACIAEARALLVVSSFDPEALRMLRQSAPDVSVAFLFGSEAQEARAPSLPGYGEHPGQRVVNAQTLARVRSRAAFVNVWTVNDPAEAARLSALGVDGLISDVPDMIRAAL